MFDLRPLRNDFHLFRHTAHPLTLLPAVDMSMEHSSDDQSIEKLTHGNYNIWAQHVQARLMELGVWRLCSGDEAFPTAPPPLNIATNASSTEVIALNRKFKEDTPLYNETLHHNDKAIGTIVSLLELDQLQHIEKLTSAKEVWDHLQSKHADIHMGLAAFYGAVRLVTTNFVQWLCSTATAQNQSSRNQIREN